MEKKKVVIALGGNALGKDVEEQKEAVAKTAKVIVDLAQPVSYTHLDVYKRQQQRHVLTT